MRNRDVLIIGAGFAGLYQLHRLRELGFDAHVVEAGSDVGGTWFWNRYPGARCDVESVEYSYSFDSELEQEWNWSERYAAQPEILSYIQHVAERHDLRKDITFDTRVRSLTWDEDASTWSAETESGDVITSRYVIAATGCLSVPSRPSFAGMDDFAGELYSTSSWPHDGVDLAGKRVAVIGTGSSGLQTITAIASIVGSLTVFQRTPVYAVPAHNGPGEATLTEAKARYAEKRAISRASIGGLDCAPSDRAFVDMEYVDAEKELDRRWSDGGLCFTAGFTDVFSSVEANTAAAEYIRARIRTKVNDSVTAEKLIPRTYPVGTKRLCVDTGYYEVYNQDNVSLVDINENPIVRFTERGIVSGSDELAFDIVILATGFDAMTGALNAIDIRQGDRTLRQKWEHGPQTYLGLMTAGFPNLFVITGPQSPSVLSNMVVSIEHHVEWIANLLVHMREGDLERVEADVDAEKNWVNTTNDLASFTLMPQANSWYLGANIPGKERVFMPFIGGVGTYRQIADGIATAGYHGFELV